LKHTGERICSSECHSCSIHIVNAKYGTQPYYALYFTIGDQHDGRIFLLVGYHCIVNILCYYYYCHNIVLVNKIACLLARYDMRYQTFVYWQQFATRKSYALYWVSF